MRLVVHQHLASATHSGNLASPRACQRERLMQVWHTQRLILSRTAIRLPLCTLAFFLLAAVTVLPLATVPALECLLPSGHRDHAPRVRPRATLSGSSTK